MMDLVEAVDEVISHFAGGGDYIVVNDGTRSRPLLHQLCISLPLGAVQGTGKVLRILLTLGNASGVMLLFHGTELDLPVEVARHEAELNNAWTYFRPKDLMRAHDRLRVKAPEEARDPLSRHWKMSAGEVSLTETSVHIVQPNEADTAAPEVTTRALLFRGKAAYASLLRSPPDTKCSVTFAAFFGGELVTCEVRIQAHTTPQEQIKTRAAWCGMNTVQTPTGINPPRSRFLEVTAALACIRPRDWGTQNDTLLLGSPLHAISAGVIIHRPARPPLSLAYSASFRGPELSSHVVNLLCHAYAAGNAIRFGLKRIEPSRAPPEAAFPAWSDGTGQCPVKPA